jgi:hypothetical protein
LTKPSLLKIWTVLAAQGDKKAVARIQSNDKQKRQKRMLAAAKPDNVFCTEWQAIIKLARKGNDEAKGLIAESAKPTWAQCLQLLADNGDSNAASALKDLKDQKQRKRDPDEVESESPSGKAAGTERNASTTEVTTAHIDEKIDPSGEDDDQSAVLKVQSSTPAYSTDKASGAGGPIPTEDDKVQPAGQHSSAPSVLRRDSFMSQNNDATAVQDVGVGFDEALVETEEQQPAREKRDPKLEEEGAPHKKPRTSL